VTFAGFESSCHLLLAVSLLKGRGNLVKCLVQVLNKRTCRLRAVHKRRPHKIAKNWPLPLVCKMFALGQPLVRADTPKISKNPKFLHQKVRTSASEEPPPSLSAKCPHWKPPDCGRLLWTAPYSTLSLMLNVKQGSCKHQLLKSFGLTRPEDLTQIYRVRGGRSNH